MWCFTRRNAHSILETEALKLNNIANMVTRKVRYNSSLVAVVKFVINISAVVKRGHSVHFVVARIADIVDYMEFSGFSTGIRSQTYQRYIQAAKPLFQLSFIIILIKFVAREETGAWMLGFVNLYNGTAFISCTEKEPVVMCASSGYAWNGMQNHLFQLCFPTKVGEVFCASSIAISRHATQPVALPFLHYYTNSIPHTRLKLWP